MKVTKRPRSSKKPVTDEENGAGGSSDQEYPVEKIINMKVSNDATYYQVKWEGYDETTWSPIWDLDGCQKPLADFHYRVIKSMQEMAGTQTGEWHADDKKPAVKIVGASKDSEKGLQFVIARKGIRGTEVIEARKLYLQFPQTCLKFYESHVALQSDQ